MKKITLNILIIAMFISIPATSSADLKVILANESDLPFDLSPSKFKEFLRNSGGILGTSMISFVKGKMEVSPDLPD